MPLQMAQRTKLLQQYPKPSTDTAHVPTLDAAIKAAHHSAQPQDSPLFKAQRAALDAANPLIVLYDLLLRQSEAQPQEETDLDVGEIIQLVQMNVSPGGKQHVM